MTTPSSHFHCAHCEKPQDGFLGRHICSTCNLPQPCEAEGEQDYFKDFGFPRRFGINLSLLQEKFYQISRQLHPDRFSALGPERCATGALELSLRRMSRLNQAYTTLKNPETRRRYLLEIEGVLARAEDLASSSMAGKQQSASTGSGFPPGLPLELVEEWFEVKELSFEDPAAAKAKAKEFKEQVRQFEESLAQEIVEKESEYDAICDAPSDTKAQFEEETQRAILPQLAELIQPLSYLASLKREVEKIL